MTHARIPALALAVAMAIAAPASADPDPQFLAEIDRDLRFFQLETDVSRLTTSEAAQLYLIMASPEKRFLDTRRKLKSVIRKAEARQG
ncbi:MAG: hypothetical protein AAFQ79_03785 [Pseudomonadota bacterium]